LCSLTGIVLEVNCKGGVSVLTGAFGVPFLQCKGTSGIAINQLNFQKILKVRNCLTVQPACNRCKSIKELYQLDDGGGIL
jgi:hypothetical protein